MKAKLVLACFALFAVGAQADIINCNFTEPFLGVQYSMTQSRLRITDHAAENGPVTTSRRNISFQIMDAGEFELWDSNRNVVMKLDLDFNGSDGMSNRVYPYSAEYYHPDYGTLHGGCTSNFLHASISNTN